MTLALSTGDPAGIGPQIAVEAAARHASRDAVALFGDATWLLASLERVGATGVACTSAELPGRIRGEVAVVHACDWDADWVGLHRPSVPGGIAQLTALNMAIDAVQAGHARGLVTAPTSKEAISSAGQRFVGQTEHLAFRCGLRADDVTMLFLGARLRTALVTTHLAIADVPLAITEFRVKRALRHLAEALAAMGTEHPRIAVAGLNPHAGESGLFGNEEHVIRAALESASRPNTVGPIGAESAFRFAASQEVDGVVAMFHDQATIASKLLDWGNAVNVTWGLPFVRTSVDHGVAYDAAIRGSASCDAMWAALRLATELCPLGVQNC